ncbi:MAG: zinc-binding dehydrogenase [Candidatus Latescibacteria bacterium]|jgi:L-iditol 2-dehydrogenase|nr:zinc-binding dehydrogenase [Candidatus Latescibacterota bacterium]
MLATILVKPGVLELQEIDLPHPGPDEVVVKIKSALTCGTDLKAFRRGHRLMPMPTVFGHEFAGEIVEKGDMVDLFYPGAAVMSVHTAPCGKCVYCRRRLENLCPHMMDSKILGAYAEYIRIPAVIVKKNMFPKPANLSFREAAMLEPLSCVVYGINQIRVKSVDTAVVIGAGAIGLLHVLVLKSMGINRVIVSGHRDYRLKLAEQIGADLVVNSATTDAVEVISEATDGLGAPLVFECTGQPSVWEESVEMVSRGGDIILFGGCPGGSKVTYDADKLHYDQITLKGVFHYTPAAVKQAYNLLVEKHIDVSPLISADRRLKDISAVFQDLMTQDCIKYAILPESA